MERKRRVVWTKKEMEQVITKIAELARLDSRLKPPQLFKRGMRAALPEQRWWAVTGVSRERYMPFVESAMEQLALHSAQPVLVTTLLESKPEPPAQNDDIQTVLREVRELCTMIRALFVELGSSPPKLAQVPQPVERSQPQPVKAELPRRQIDRKPSRRLPKVAVIGLIADQPKIVKDKVADIALLTCLDADKQVSASQLEGYDYVVVMRHARHFATWAAQEAVGRDRTIRLNTTGLGTLVDTIRGLVKQSNGLLTNTTS